MIGKVLNERYELTEILGEGGMALVYKSKDQILDRWVALKILRPQLVSDKDFVNRFHREAKAVARLSHPNVVNIYDIGQDGDIHYLVMENIQGENLKEMIEKSGILAPEKALNIAIQICEALVVAHRNNIIHCDIKPHNILITPENGVKVTDFGIARAVNSATLAQTETVIGTAHYFSPEQARGGTINASSDLYSLGVVLYEMLTGQVPFRGDSPITVALKHINEEPLPPSQLNDKLPKRIDKLVMKALAKDPEKRYTDASEMLAALQEMEKTFVKKNETSESYVDSDKTQVLPRVKDQRIKESAASKEVKEDGTGKSVAIQLIKYLTIMVVVFSLLGVAFLWGLNRYTKVPVVEVPNFVNLSEEDASQLAREKGLRISFNDLKVSSPTVAEGHVVSQDIEPGKGVKKNRIIMLTLSKGATMTIVPDLIGKDMRQVNVALNEADLTRGDTKYEFTTKIPKDQVITQDPLANESVKSGTAVNIVLSKGPEPVMGTIPALVGLSRQEAEQRITEANFVIGDVTEEETNRFPADLVAKQEPEAGKQVSEGTPINLVVSTGLKNPNNLEVQSFRVNIRVPGGPYEQKIQVVVEDSNGRDIIYDKIHHPDDYILIENVWTVGPAKIEVYNNDELVSQQSEGL